MLTANRLKARLGRGEPVFGLFASIPAPVAVEMIAYAGYDFVIIDTEHAMVNPETVENMIRAAEAAGITPLVRVPGTDGKEIVRALDAGAQGIVVPHVETAEQAERAVAAARFYPDGRRSLNSGRPGAFGRDSLTDYIRMANGEIMVVPMIESAAGVDNAERIAAVNGIDMVLEGSADLSQSYGVPWQFGADIVRHGLERVLQAALRAGIPYCAIPREPGDYPAWREKGAAAFVLGDERGIAFRALRQKLETLRQLQAEPGRREDE